MEKLFFSGNQPNIIMGVTDLDIEVSGKKFHGFYVSYNEDSYMYGNDTTALVLGQMELFFVLNGNHKKQYQDIVNQNPENMDQCFDKCYSYFKSNVSLKSKYSDTDIEDIEKLKAMLDKSEATFKEQEAEEKKKKDLKYQELLRSQERMLNDTEDEYENGFLIKSNKNSFKKVKRFILEQQKNDFRYRNDNDGELWQEVIAILKYQDNGFDFLKDCICEIGSDDGSYRDSFFTSLCEDVLEILKEYFS